MGAQGVRLDGKESVVEYRVPSTMRVASCPRS